MLKRSWIFLLPLVASLLWAGSAPSQATSASWSFAGVNSTGCANDTWDIAVTFEGVSTVQHQFHTVVSSGGLVYMNQGFDDTFPDGNDTWGLYSSSTYGPTTGTYPIPSGQPMKVRLILERPKGTVVSSWTFVAESCDSDVLTFNAADFDNDMVADAVDKCPHLKSSRANGCPLRSRTLTLNDKYGPKRVVGKLYAPGYPLLYAGRTVKIWKKRDGPDLKVATRTTNSLGKFKAQVGKGRYYATAKGIIVASSGQATADKSVTVRVH